MTTNGKEATYAQALRHPLRISILNALDCEVGGKRRVASPSELAEELEAPLGVVSYHVRQLHNAGMLKLVKEVPRRGAMEHYYKALVRASFTVEKIR